jgi:hypothetical protein
MPMPVTALSIRLRRRKNIIQMPEKLTPATYPNSTYCAEDSPAKRFQQLVEEGALTMPEVLSSLKLPDWLKQDGQRIFCSKTYRDCCRMTKAGRLVPSSPRLMTWGTAWNGVCLTQNILESRSQDGGCSLSAILIPDAPEKYFLSSAQVAKLLYKSSAARKVPVSTTQPE